MLKVIKKHKIFAIFLLILAIYLGFKAVPKNNWDDWGFGSAQTMMSSKHWVEDGFINSKFLFLPTGYSKAVKYFDDKDLRQHAHGIRTGELIGNRLYYTHYPAGYLAPYAVLMKIGFSERFWFRWLALSFSLSGLVFMYALFNIFSTKIVAFLGVFYYAGSTMFLGLADSLANQPIDDFLRFLIMFLSAYAVFKFRNNNKRKEKKYNIIIWFLYFVLALSSYDSTFFIFVWLIGLDFAYSFSLPMDKNDILSKMKNTFSLNWKRWLIVASAPVFAFLTQLIQNMWYLGASDALLDMYGSFRVRANTGPGSNTLIKHIRAVFSPLSYVADMRARFAIFFTVILLAGFLFLKKIAVYNWPSLKIFILLFFAGSAYPFVLVSSGYFPYQGRQLAPFVGLLIASATVLVFFILKEIKSIIKKTTKIIAVFTIIFVFAVGLFWFFQTKRTYIYIKDWPNNYVEKAVIEFSDNLKKIVGGVDAVIFRIDEDSPYYYPQIHPIVEYYMDMPVLSFNDVDRLVYDYKLLKNKSELPFHSIFVVGDDEQKNKIKKLVNDDEVVVLVRSDIKEIFNTSAH